jgi:hypothetical protein
MKAFRKPTISGLAAVALLVNSRTLNEVRAIALRSEVVSKMQHMVANVDESVDEANTATETLGVKVCEDYPVEITLSNEEAHEEIKPDGELAVEDEKLH